MKAALVLAMLLVTIASCATYRDLAPGQATVADIEAVMGNPVERRTRPDGETWLYYPQQPFGRKTYVARVGADGKVIAVEQRLSEEYIAKLIPNQSRKEDVHDLFGSPYEALVFPRLERDTWTWHMHRFGIVPVSLNVQMSPDGVVREVYLLDEQKGGDKRER